MWPPLAFPAARPLPGPAPARGRGRGRRHWPIAHRNDNVIPTLPAHPLLQRHVHALPPPTPSYPSLQRHVYVPPLHIPPPFLALPLQVSFMLTLHNNDQFAAKALLELFRTSQVGIGKTAGRRLNSASLFCNYVKGFLEPKRIHTLQACIDITAGRG